MFADDGIDTFVFRDGLIRVQTVRYTLQHRGLRPAAGEGPAGGARDGPRCLAGPRAGSWNLMNTPAARAGRT